MASELRPDGVPDSMPEQPGDGLVSMGSVGRLLAAEYAERHNPDMYSGRMALKGLRAQVREEATARYLAKNMDRPLVAFVRPNGRHVEVLPVPAEEQVGRARKLWNRVGRTVMNAAFGPDYWEVGQANRAHKANMRGVEALIASERKKFEAGKAAEARQKREAQRRQVRSAPRPQTAPTAPRKAQGNVLLTGNFARVQGQKSRITKPASAESARTRYRMSDFREAQRHKAEQEKARQVAEKQAALRELVRQRIDTAKTRANANTGIVHT